MVRAVFLAFAMVIAFLITSLGSAAQIATFAPGWNLVSGPEGSHLRGAAGYIYTLQPGDTDYEAFPATAALHGGWGYWAFFVNPGGLDLSGAVVVNNYSVVPVPGEWMMVGNPSAGADATIMGADVQTESVLHPGQAAFVTASGPVTISVTVPTPTVVAPTPSPPPPIRTQMQPTARCRDGSFDFSASPAACGGSGGVAYYTPGLPGQAVDGTDPASQRQPRAGTSPQAPPLATPSPAAGSPTPASTGSPGR